VVGAPYFLGFFFAYANVFKKRHVSIIR